MREKDVCTCMYACCPCTNAKYESLLDSLFTQLDMGKTPAQGTVLLCPRVCLLLGLAGAQEIGSISLTRKALSKSWLCAGLAKR